METNFTTAYVVIWRDAETGLWHAEELPDNATAVESCRERTNAGIYAVWLAVEYPT